MKEREDNALSAVLADEIRAERNAQRLSQGELADRAGVPFGTYRRLEEDSPRPIKIDVLAKVATALGLEPEELLRRALQRRGKSTKP